MARRRKREERVSHERWLVSYADFITLLFAFFVVMFAASNADQRKAGQVAQAVQVAFTELAAFAPSGKVFPLYDEGGLPSNEIDVIGDTHSAFAEAQLVAVSDRTAGKGEYTIEQVQHLLSSMLADEVEAGRVRLTMDSRGLTVTLAEAGFFAPGSAVLEGGALPIVDRIAEELRELPYSVRVEGHTDNVPIQTPRFPSNWELSTSRATHVLQYLISNGQIPPSRLSAVGYGEYRPVASNESREGRAMNRRVDIVVLNTFSEEFEPKALARKALEETGLPLAFLPTPAEEGVETGENPAGD